MKYTRRSTKRTTRKRRGGAYYPAPYFNAPLKQPSAEAGRDLLGYTTEQIRPRIGGFVPSVGEPFVALAGKYIVPLSLYMGYKFMTRKNKATTKAKASGRRGKTVRSK